MNIDFPQELGSAGDAVFASLRAKLAGEVESSAMLADLLQKLNGMQEAQARPADFKERFDVFVVRAEEYLEVVRPFIPALVQFLPAHMGSFGDIHDHHRKQNRVGFPCAASRVPFLRTTAANVRNV